MDLQSKVSSRITAIKPSGIRKFSDYAKTFDHVISLGIGEPDFTTPEVISKAGIEAIEKGHTHYTDNRGLADLRKEICEYYKRSYNASYDYETECLVTVGSSEGIDLAIRMLIDPGEEIVLTDPGYVAYESAVKAAGGKIVKLHLDAEHEFKVTPEALEAVLTPKTKVLLLNYPNNPTGASMSHDDLAQLVPIIKEHELLVISDEIYSELSYDEPYCSLSSFKEIKPQVLTINGFSKAFAMTGWRLGYILADAIFIKEMLKIHQFGIICPPAFAQYAALEGLKNGAEAVKAMHDEYLERRNYLVKALNDLGLATFMPKGAFYVFSDIRSTHMTSEEFAVALLKDQRVACTPGDAFGEGGEGFMRISYAYSLDKLEKAMAKLKVFLDHLDHK
jgi:aminotransferase